MNKMARVGRLTTNGQVQIAAVNVAKVLYVTNVEQGSYITFRDAHDASTRGVTPVGVHSPDSVEEVISRLNNPYWIDLGLRIGSLFVATAAVVLAIIFG